MNTFKHKLDEVWSILGGETERGCVIVAAAMLDNALRDLLAARLRPPANASDEILDSAHSPASSFSARIDLAYRVGGISTSLRKSLHIIRKLRNDFAHVPARISFEDQSVRDRTSSLLQLNACIVASAWSKMRPKVEDKVSLAPQPPFARDEDALSDMLEHAGLQPTFALLASAFVAVIASVATHIAQVSTDALLEGE